MTTYRGKLEAGKIILREMPKFPDGTEVEVTLTPLAPAGVGGQPEETPSAVDEDDPALRIAERAVPTGLPDLAAEHDHYIYGTPKRGDGNPR